MSREYVSARQTGMIVNGQVSHRGKWPWLVALSTKSDGEFFCGGSLISERFVLSAAHCLQYKNEQTPKEPKDVIVSLGKWNISDKQELGALELTPFEFIIHPDWKISESRWNADIALIKLETDVTFSSSITPICLWTSKMRPEEMNDGGTAVGWGKMENQTIGGYSEVPREARLKIFPIADCYEKGLAEVMSRRGLCVGGEGYGPCNGDSGGGIFTAQGGKWFVRGITSVSLLNVHMDCNVNRPAGFTNVGMFSEWIEGFLNEGEQMRCDFSFNENSYECKMQNSITRKDSKFVQVIGSHVDHLTPRNVTSFLISDNAELKFLPIKLGDFFRYLGIYDVHSSGVQEIFRNNFADLQTLGFLSICGCALKQIPTDTFYDLINLRELWLTDNQIVALDSTTFIYNSELRFLQMFDNKIKLLESSTFQNTSELTIINFESNLLTSIGAELLSHLLNLEAANFSNNTCIDAGYEKVGKWIENSVSKENLENIFATECQ